MKMQQACFVAVLLVSAVLAGASSLAAAQQGGNQPAKASAQSVPQPQVVPIKPGVDYQILIQPPATDRTRSGQVVLRPGKSVGRHSTEGNEEILVILEGTGEFTVEGGPTLKMSPNVIVYCPPNRFHNVTNTGTGILRYFFIVGKAQ